MFLNPIHSKSIFVLLVFSLLKFYGFSVLFKFKAEALMNQRGAPLTIMMIQILCGALAP